MSCKWSARWCSLDEIGGIQHLIFTPDGSAEGVSRAHCLVEASDRRFGVSLHGAGGVQTGFWRCPASDCLVVIFENSVVVVDLTDPACHSVVDVHWIAGAPIISSRYVVLWSFWAVTLIASSSEITEERFDADIEAVSLRTQPERLEMSMLVSGQTVERSLFI